MRVLSLALGLWLFAVGLGLYFTEAEGASNWDTVDHVHTSFLALLFDEEYELLVRFPVFIGGADNEEVSTRVRSTGRNCIQLPIVRRLLLFPSARE